MTIDIDGSKWIVGCSVRCHFIKEAHKEFSNYIRSIENESQIDLQKDTTSTCQNPFIGFVITHFYRGVQLNGKYSINKSQYAQSDGDSNRKPDDGNHPT